MGTESESADVRERKVRDTALVEANYAVGLELAHGSLTFYTAGQYNQRVIERARMFELYLDQGYDVAALQVAHQLDEENRDPEAVA